MREGATKGGSNGTSDLRIASFAGMFSPATFYDVLHAAAGKRAGEGKRPARPYVVAFYGFKGGAGRSMALAHAAALLAYQGAKIVAVDLDLEAPGLDVILGVSTPADIEGTASLLRQATMRPRGETLDVVASLRQVELPGARGAVWVLPAGKLDEHYLATIEELNLHLWHTMDPPQPLQRVLQDLATADIQPNAIFLDCRTGFNGLSATALFHVADLVVVCFTLSPQMWEGLDVLVAATRHTQDRRGGAPELVLLPTLVPSGPSGKETFLKYVDRVEERFAPRLGADDPEISEDPDAPRALCLDKGIPYDPSIAGVGRLDPGLRAVSWGHYRELADRIGSAWEMPGEAAAEALDKAAVLGELAIDRRSAFGDEVSIDDLVQNFVPPGDLVRVLDPSSALVIGAKGAGKTWLFRYLVGTPDKPRSHLPAQVTYVVGHAPSAVIERGPLNLSPEQLAELEKKALMAKRESHMAFWRLYAAARIGRSLPLHIAEELDVTGLDIDAKARRAVTALWRAAAAPALQAALDGLLARDDVASISDAVLRRVDELVLQHDLHLTLAYDGLDTGFDVGGKKLAADRQKRFVEALLKLLLNRGQLRRIQFKIFLREDIFLSVEMQNKSHLDAATVELRWRPGDLWRMALTRAKESPTYLRHIAALPGGQEEVEKLDESTVQKLLEPLWGATVQGGRKARTALYISKRTSDAADRLFPRTLLQLLAAAIEMERGASAQVPAERGRVLSFPAIKRGVDEASKKRVEDLIAEYASLKPYLNALREWKAVATQDGFADHLRQMSRREHAGMKASTLHVGPGGWTKVITLLKNVGVLGEYQRDRGTAEAPKLAVALLYRPGLQLRAD